MTLRFAGVAAIALALFSGASIAATTADIVKARQDSFKQIGRANKAIKDELAKPSPSLLVVRTNAETLLTASRRAAALFPPGTAAGLGLTTKASPVIWQRGADFRAKSGGLINTVTALRNAAAANNLAQVTATFRVLGTTCKGCHDTYRSR